WRMLAPLIGRAIHVARQPRGGGAMTRGVGAEEDVCRWLAEREGEMLALLEEVVNIDSGSYDKAGVDAVGERFARFFADHGIPVSWRRGETYGDALRAELACP